MLGERTRKILFWATAAVVALVVIAGMISALRLLIRPRAEITPLEVIPPEALLCPAQQVDFSVEPPLSDVEWAATGGGEISLQGRYTAGELPGDYEIRAAGPEGQLGRAVVHIVLCTPSPTPAPSATPTPLPTPTVAPTPIPPADPQGDVGLYSSGAPVASPPAGLDILNASMAPDRSLALQPDQDAPSDLAGWAAEGEALLWIALYDPIPETMDALTQWLFALDLDGDAATGRPMGTGRVNPDIGMEVALGVELNPADQTFVPYFLIWDPAQGGWIEGPDVARFTLNESRTLVALAVPLDALQQLVTEVTGVTWVPEAAVGRAAAVSYVEPEAVIDLYPDPTE
jgi:hypothetical protein